MKFINVFFVLALCCSQAWAHQYISSPLSRTGTNPVTGIAMGSSLLTSSGSYVQDGSRKLYGRPNSAYFNRPCSGVGRTMQSTIEMPGTYAGFPSSAFDVSIKQTPRVTYTAGQEVTLSFTGYHHPGLVSVRLCYSNCMSMTGYEGYILGYWWMEGTSGTISGQGSIYSAVVSAKVKIPNKNCENCILQYITDSLDLRSYVNCVDVRITGASSTTDNSYYCNGHPYCNCSTTATSGSYGLNRRCPVGMSSSSRSHAIVSQIGTSAFCKYCITNGCPSTCGGKWDGSYNGANTLRGTHTSGLPVYIKCTSANCKCPGCISSTGSSIRDVDFEGGLLDGNATVIDDGSTVADDSTVAEPTPSSVTIN